MGYRGPNKIPEDVPEREQTLILLVRILDSEDEPVTRGMLYNFVILNSLVIGHLGKKDHKSQLVTPIIMKPIVLDQENDRLP